MWNEKPKLLENNRGENLDDLEYPDDFFNIIPKAQSTHTHKRTEKLNFMKIKNVCPAKDSVKRMRRQATDWEKKILSQDIYR